MDYRNKLRNAVRAIVVVGLLAAVSPLLAAEGRFPIYQPVSIPAPGNYVLTRDVSSAGVVIEVPFDGVKIDLNGFTVTNTAGGMAIDVQASNVTIANGTVQGGDQGVFASNRRDITIEWVNFLGQASVGVELNDVSNFRILDSRFVNSSAAGILLNGSGVGALMQGTVEGNQLEGTGDGIVAINAASVAIRNNRLLNPNFGIVLENCGTVHVGRNTVRDAVDTGIELRGTVASALSDNVVSGSVKAGILLDAGTADVHVVGNNVSGGADHGIVVDGRRNQVRDNLVNGNAFWGMFLSGLSSGTMLRGNFAIGNNSAAVGCPGVAPDTGLCHNGPHITHGDNYIPSPY